MSKSWAERLWSDWFREARAANAETEFIYWLQYETETDVQKQWRELRFSELLLPQEERDALGW